MSLPNFSQLGTKYILLDLLGIGGMAEVYRCKLVGQQGFEKIIVLKKLLSEAAKDQERVANFIDEARLAALLQHENIGHVYDFGEIDGNYFIAMEYLFGKDLFTIVQQTKQNNKSIDIEPALFITSKICEGMGYAHSLKDLEGKPLNIIHRDLTPHNVFVTYDGKVKIIDFGVARAELFDNRTKAGVVKGKVSYMSPEQLTEENVDQRSDIFSIGILLYEMLSGKRMYEGDTATLIRKGMQVDYDRLEAICPGLPRELYGIVDKALQADRDKRYQTCGEMAAAIEDFLYQLKERPSSQKLQSFMHDLFGKEYEAENKKLVETVKKFDELHGASTQEKTTAEELTGQIEAEDKTVVMTVAQEEQAPEQKAELKKNVAKTSTPKGSKKATPATEVEKSASEEPKKTKTPAKQKKTQPKTSSAKSKAAP
ncbi:MAG: protein kinase, partial [Desulfocapsaceae bacterium]|nr:protein kinase [Desulfocapsaceae bacterium]